MFSNNYKECFVICKVKKLDDESYALDLPFPTTSQCIIYDDKCWYESIPQVYGAEVLAHITYLSSDDNNVKSFDGYIADNSTSEGRLAIQTHPRFAEFWTEKNETLYDEQGEVIGEGDVLYPCVYLRPDYEDR